MNLLWSNFSGHCSVLLVLSVLAVAGMDWRGENVGALRGVSMACGSGPASVANVRSADIVSAELVAIALRKWVILACVDVNCHGSQAGGHLVRAWQSRGGGDREARLAIGSQYITPETKFLHCHGPVLVAKKRKGARA
jgi:hypothetical protein